MSDSKTTKDGEFNGNKPDLTLLPVAATEDRDVDWVDVTGWGVFDGHAIPIAVARRIAERINLYHAHRSSQPTSVHPAILLSDTEILVLRRLAEINTTLADKAADVVRKQEQKHLALALIDIIDRADPRKAAL